MLMSTTGDVIVYRTDSSLTIEFDALPENSAIFAVSDSIVGIAIVHESVATFAGRHILTALSSSHRSLLLLNVITKYNTLQ